MSKRKKGFKIKLSVEIEMSQVFNEQNQREGIGKSVYNQKVTTEIIEKKLFEYESWSESEKIIFAQPFNYLEKNLEKAVKNRIKLMTSTEFLLENFRGEFREKSINLALKLFEKELRKMTENGKKGATPNKDKSEWKYQKEREEFLTDAKTHFNPKGKRKQTRTAFASLLFPDNSNPLKAFRDRLKRFEFDDYDEFMKEVGER